MAMPLGKVREGCPLLSVPDGVPTKSVEAFILLSVEYVQVSGPPDRDDGLCSIYGYIRACDRGKGPAVTLFDRSRDEAETVDLNDPSFHFLTLSDDGSARPLLGGYGISVKMKLWEKLPRPADETQPKVDDPLLVDADFEFDGFCKTNRRCYIEFQGYSGFDFYMAYTNFNAGVAGEVRVTINKDIAAARAKEEEAELTVKRKRPIASTHIYGTMEAELTGKRRRPIGPMLIYGTIGVTQTLIEDELTAMKLFYVSSTHRPVQVDIGSPIDLHRKLVVLPVSAGVLGIAYTLFDATTDRLIVKNAIPFCIRRAGGFVKAPEDLTYTQHGDDGLVTVSLTLVPYKCNG